MNELLMIVGVLVFFISVYGAVMVGGYLLEELGRSDEASPVRPPAPDPERTSPTPTPTPKPTKPLHVPV